MNLKTLKNIRIKPHAVLTMIHNNELRKTYDLKCKPSTVKVLNTILEHESTKCQLCGLDNMYFKVKESNYITPYYTKPNGNPVLVTIDHNLLKSLGGSDLPKNLSLLCMDCNYKRDNISAELKEFLDNPEMKPNFSYVEYNNNLTRHTLNYETDNIHPPIVQSIKLAIHEGEIGAFVYNEAVARYLYGIYHNSTKMQELKELIRTEIHERAFSTVQKMYPELTAIEVQYVLNNCKSYKLAEVNSLISKKYIQNKSKRYNTLKTIVQFSNEKMNRILMEAHAVTIKLMQMKAQEVQEVQEVPERTFFYMEDTQVTPKYMQYWKKFIQYIKGKFNAKSAKPKEYRMY